MNLRIQQTRNSFNLHCAAFCLLLLCGMATTGHASTITVTSTANSGAGTLRAALASAINGDTINFSLATPATITLMTDQLYVSNSVSILGPGPGNLSINGNAANRVFYIRPSNTVTFASLTITNGAGGALGGGGIFNDHSTLALSNCILSGNSASYGGAIFNDGRNSTSATLTVVNSIISSNSADGYGGGIYNVGDSGGATVTVSNCVFNRNAAGNSGGGIDNRNWTAGFATLTVIASTVNSNSAGQFGGGIHNNGEHAGHVTMTVSGSTFNSNSANVGGGINNDSRESGNAIGTVAGCTLGSNACYGPFATGGAIYNNAEFSGSATLTVSNCILNSNWADYTTGGIYNDGSGGGSTGILNMASCTLSGNSSASIGCIYNDGGNNGHAMMNLYACTVSGNSAGSNLFSAGAIFNNANISLTNCTISGNSAGAMFSVGGILNNGSLSTTILTMIASTMSGNSATNSFSAGGIYNYIGNVQLGGTILNAGAAGTNILHSSGTISSLGYNLSSDGGSGRLTNATDQINTNPMLGPLQYTGGSTFTHALLANSPAIDKSKSFGLTTDQRGLLRPYDASSITNANGGDGSDIGAFEMQFASAPILLAGLQSVGNGAFQLSFTNTPGAAFTIIGSTNIALATSNWIALGAATEISPGHFQFTDPQATNRSQGYYSVRSP